MSAVFGEIGAQRPPVARLPAALKMAAVMAGDAGVVEGEARALGFALSLASEREADQRIDTGWPVLRPPSLHDALSWNELDIAAADPAAVAGERAALLAADLGRAVGGHCRMLARTHQDVIDAARTRLECIDLMDAGGHDELSLTNDADVAPRSKPGGEARHDHDDGDLHGALHRHHAHVSAHPARQLVVVGRGLQDFEIKLEIHRQQITEP